MVNRRTMLAWGMGAAAMIGLISYTLINSAGSTALPPPQVPTSPPRQSLLPVAPPTSAVAPHGGDTGRCVRFNLDPDQSGTIVIRSGHVSFQAPIDPAHGQGLERVRQRLVRIKPQLIDTPHKPLKPGTWKLITGDGPDKGCFIISSHTTS